MEPSLIQISSGGSAKSLKSGTIILLLLTPNAMGKPRWFNREKIEEDKKPQNPQEIEIEKKSKDALTDVAKKLFSDELEIRNYYSTPAYPQCNGQAEMV